MFTPFDEDIVRLLGEGKTVKEIWRILFPEPDSGYSYMAFLSHVNVCGLRNVTENAGYEVAPNCVKCENCISIQRYEKGIRDLKACVSEKKEISRYVQTSPSWCPKRDHKRQGEL